MPDKQCLMAPANHRLITRVWGSHPSSQVRQAVSDTRHRLIAVSLVTNSVWGLHWRRQADWQTGWLLAGYQAK